MLQMIEFLDTIAYWQYRNVRPACVKVALGSTLDTQRIEIAL
jgi:hypothetical protein